MSMKTVREVYFAAMALMDELEADGKLREPESAEYEARTPDIMRLLISEYRILDGKAGAVVAPEGMEDYILGVDDTYALGVMQYGLAANLLVDENPTAASFYEQRYEELRNIYFSRRTTAEGEEIENLYGGIEFGEMGRW